jgi:hypothetical protein
MRDGAVVEYLTKAEAQQEAMRLEVDRNHLYATTFFEYWVAEYAATKHTTTKHTTTAKKQEGA